MAVNNFQQSIMGLGQRFGDFYEANKPHIFTGIGIVGTISTGVLAAQSGSRSARKIDRKERELGRKLTAIEKGKLCWMDYIAPVAVGAVSCYSTYKVDSVLSAELAKRTTMLIASEKAYEKLSDKTKEVLGEKKAKQIQDEVVTEKVEQAKQLGSLTLNDFVNAPRVGNGQLSMFVDAYTMLPFWSNRDYIALQVLQLQQMMADLAPRDPDRDYNNKKVGVPYREWLNRIGYTDPRITETPERKDRGWNKGYDKKYHRDDDVIDFEMTPIAWDENITAFAVSFTTPPSDMTLGRLIKSSNLF